MAQSARWAPRDIWIRFVQDIHRTTGFTLRGGYTGMKTYIYIYIGVYIYTGWWLSHPSEKYEFVSWGYEIPNIRENKKMFQTTKPEHIYIYEQPICIVSLCHPYLMVSSTKLFVKLPRVWSKIPSLWDWSPFFHGSISICWNIINHY